MSRLWLAVVLTLLALVATSKTALAHPFMIKSGYANCATCHTDPSGGKLLNLYGRMQATQLLSTKYGQEDEDLPSGGALWGLWEQPDFVALGGAYRQGLVVRTGESSMWRTFPEQADLYALLAPGDFRLGGSLGIGRVAPGSPHLHAAQVTQTQGDGWNLISRDHWLGYDLAGKVLVRAGRLNLPFGIRTTEHTSWVRAATRTDLESDGQHGLALAYAGSSIRGEVMVILGNYQLNPDRYRERGYSLYVEQLLAPDVAFGVSSLVTHAEADWTTLVDASTTRQAHGLFARATLLPPLVLLAETNLLVASRRDLGYVGWVELDLEPIQGLHVAARGELLDEGLIFASTDTAGTSSRTPGQGRVQAGGFLVLDWFFLPQFEARLDAGARALEPFTLMGQLHVWL